MYNIPILLIIFKRKDVTLRTLESIKAIKPTTLYIAGDGAREYISGEKEKVDTTRKAVLDAIDWECKVKTRFLEENQGCSKGVYNAINWLFENEKWGIIIEDDCMLRASFFPFAEEMLQRYKDDLRIGMIDAANYLPEIEIPDSYGFSRYKSTNGWATWRRAWKLMDLDMKWRNGVYEDSIIANMSYKSKEHNYWKYRLKAVDENDVSAWDWQWYFTLAAHNMLGIYPKYSLTTNIGFGEDATHTSNGEMPSYYISDKDLDFPLQHPKYMVPYLPFEKEFYEKLNDTNYEKIKRLIPFSLKRKIKKLLKK